MPGDFLKGEWLVVIFHQLASWDALLFLSEYP